MLGALQATAADEKAVAAVAPAAADASANARKEFEAVKASRGGALPLTTKGEVPRVIFPEMRMPAPVEAAPLVPKVQVMEKRPANWLVEAMEKPDDSRPERGRGRTEVERRREATEIGMDQTDGRRSETKIAEDRERRPKATVVNPLDRFLGEWMTPQDYALLKPGLTQRFDAGPDSLAGKEPEGAVTGIGLPSGPAREAVGLRDTSSPRPAAGAPRENPYLSALTGISAPVIPAAVPSLVVAPAVVQAPTLPPPVVATPAPARTQLPAFLKPATDEKYFKQLKRF